MELHVFTGGGSSGLKKNILDNKGWEYWSVHFDKCSYVQKKTELFK
jgi:hypothetical protein